MRLSEVGRGGQVQQSAGNLSARGAWRAWQQVIVRRRSASAAIGFGGDHRGGRAAASCRTAAGSGVDRWRDGRGAHRLVTLALHALLTKRSSSSRSCGRLLASPSSAHASDREQGEARGTVAAHSTAQREAHRREKT